VKKYLNICFLIAAGFISSIIPVKAQDVNYSQFFNTQTYYNPALTGITTGLRAGFSFRDQWPKLPVDFMSYYFSSEISDRNKKGFGGGVGLMVSSNNEGLSFIQNFSVGLSIGMRIPITGNIFAQVGFKGSYVQKRFNVDDFIFADQLSERYGNIYGSYFIPPDIKVITFADFGTGGLIQFEYPEAKLNGIVGLAVDHIFQPNESFLSTSILPLPRKYVAHADLEVTIVERKSIEHLPKGVGDPLTIRSGVLFQNQNKKSLLQAGMNIQIFNITVGAWYKGSINANSGSSFTGLVGPNIFFGKDNSIKILYSYDLQISKGFANLGGAHEISLVLSLGSLRLLGTRDDHHSTIGTSGSETPTP
jgi:type IX secretion system PorP/SprF family membrane protein